MSKTHPGERTRAQVNEASLPAAAEAPAEEKHEHTPFLFGWKTGEDGRLYEIWRCLSDFQVSELVPNPNHDPDHEHHVKELAGQGPDLVAGRTIYPGDPDHPYGQPCGYVDERLHKREHLDNAQSAKMTQLDYEASIAPRSAKAKA